jgi:hypothetical protein
MRNSSGDLRRDDNGVGINRPAEAQTGKTVEVEHSESIVDGVEMKTDINQKLCLVDALCLRVLALLVLVVLLSRRWSWWSMAEHHVVLWQD